MPGNPRDMIVSAERRFPVRIRIGVPPGGFLPALYRDNLLAGRKLRRRRLGNDTVRDARGAQRCGVDLFPRRHTRERLRCPVVCWLQNRDSGGRVQGTDGRADGEDHSELAPNAVIQKKPRPAFGERSLRGGSEVTGREAMAVALGAEDPAVIVELPYSASGCFAGWASAKAGMAMQVL